MNTQLLAQLKLYKAVCYSYPLIEQASVKKELQAIACHFKVPLLELQLSEDLSKSLVNAGLYVVEHLPSLLGELQGWQKTRLESWLIDSIHQCRLIQDRYLILLDNRETELARYLSNIIPTEIRNLPTVAEIQSLIKQELKASGITSDVTEQMALSVSGLSNEEVKLAVQKAIASCGDLVQGLIAQKQQTLKGLGLEFLPSPDVPTFGGLDRLKEAIEQVALDYSEQARGLNLPIPKGWLMAGPPGTGKTFAAKVCAAKLGFPLISVGVDIVKSKGAGYLKRLLKVIEAASPSVCYFDEFDKFFDPDAAVTGGGTTKETLGVLLTWFQEKTTKTFVIATLNRLDALPPELTRAGRFDRLFYVGFPQAVERQEIIELHASRFDPRFRGETAMTERDWRVLLNRTQNCTGAELRAIAELAAKEQFYQGNVQIHLKLDDFLKARSKITPLYVRDTERVLAMANRAKGVCENASASDCSIFAPLEQSLWGD